MDPPVVAFRRVRELNPNQTELLIRIGFLMVLFSVAELLYSTNNYTAAAMHLLTVCFGLVIGFALIFLGMVLPRNPALLRRVNSVVRWLHGFYIELFVC